MLTLTIKEVNDDDFEEFNLTHWRKNIWFSNKLHGIKAYKPHSHSVLLEYHYRISLVVFNGH